MESEDKDERDEEIAQQDIDDGLFNYLFGGFLFSVGHRVPMGEFVEDEVREEG